MEITIIYEVTIVVIADIRDIRDCLKMLNDDDVRVTNYSNQDMLATCICLLIYTVPGMAQWDVAQFGVSMLRFYSSGVNLQKMQVILAIYRQGILLHICQQCDKPTERV